MTFRRSSLTRWILPCVALLLPAVAAAGIMPSFPSFSGELWATETQGGRKMVRDSVGFYHFVYEAWGGLGGVPAIEYVYSLDLAGTVWSPPLPVLGTAPGYKPALAIDGADLLHLVWSDSAEIWYANAPAASGGLWSLPVNLSLSPSASIFPSLATDAANAVHVVWQEVDWLPQPPFPDEIFYSSSNDGGVTFSPPLNLTNNLNESERPAVACPLGGAPGSVHVVWDELPPAMRFQIYHTAFSGLAWSAPTLVSQIMPGVADTEGLGASLVVDAADRPHVAYAHWNAIAGKGVFYNLGTPMGGAWSFGNRVQVAATVNTKDVANPSIALDADGVLRLLWHDDAIPPSALRTVYYAYQRPVLGGWSTPVSFINPDWHCASYIDARHPVRGGFAGWTDGPVAPTVLVAGASPPFLVRLSGTPVAVKRGQQVSWSISLDNVTVVRQSVDIWLEAAGPVNASKLYASVNMPPGGGSGTMKLTIPAFMPLGNYVISVAVGKMGVEDWDRDAFAMTVNP